MRSLLAAVATRCIIIMTEKTLRWAGHMQRISGDRLPKAVLYWELADGTRRLVDPRRDTKTTEKTLSKSVRSTQASSKPYLAIVLTGDRLSYVKNTAMFRLIFAAYTVMWQT